MIHERNQVFVNMTPHEINFYLGDEVVLTIPPSGDTIRLDEEWSPLGEFTFELDDEGHFMYSDENPDDSFTLPIECCRMSAGAELPPIEDNVWYIVSRAVCEAYPNRTDFVMVGKTVRDDNGRICGCRCFSQLF